MASSPTALYPSLVWNNSSCNIPNMVSSSPTTMMAPTVLDPLPMHPPPPQSHYDRKSSKSYHKKLDRLVGKKEGSDFGIITFEKNSN